MEESARFDMDTGRVERQLGTGTWGRPREGEIERELAAIYDAYSGSLYRYLLALLSRAEDAEDALQEVFVGLLRRRGRGEIENLQAYLFRAARNQALTIRRKRKKRERESAAAALSWIDVEACDPEAREMAIEVDRCLPRLPAEQREVMVLRLSEGLTFREIAELLGLPLNTATGRYRLGLSKLRALLKGAGPAKGRGTLLKGGGEDA